MVRDKAVESLRNIADKHSTAALEENFCPLIRQLAQGWLHIYLHTVRSSFCSMIVNIFASRLRIF